MNPAPRRTFEVVLKWAGGITALLSLVFAVHQFVSLLSDTRERQREIAELAKVGKLQQSQADYQGAWASFEKALRTAEPGGLLSKLTGRLGDERSALRRDQEDLAMDWLENVRIVSSAGETFTAIVDKLAPALNRGAVSASGARKADLLAHIGWAQFLKWREGHRGANPEQSYRQALAIDAANPYAHAFLAHWLLWRGGTLAAAQQQFSAALASGRARGFVRSMQLAALRNRGSEGEAAYLRSVDEMRRNGEPIDAGTRRETFAIYARACARKDDFERVAAALPGDERLATFRALFFGEHDADFEGGRRRERDACLAALESAAAR